MRYHCYGYCCLETDEKIYFDHMLKWCCSVKEIEVYLVCEIVIQNFHPKSRKTAASLLNECHKMKVTKFFSLLFDSCQTLSKLSY